MRIDLTNININLYRLVPLALILWPAANAVADYSVAQVLPTSADSVAIAADSTYLAKGDEVAGYEITSEYDLARTHPVRGTIEPHYGVDVGTPIGTKIIAPEKTVVVCWFDANGGGEVATVKTEQTEVKLLHLSSCADGSYKQGEVFARTGDSGIGTGAHLDVRRADKTEPTKADVEPFLTGKPYKPGLSDTEIVCSIGAAEGTRDRNCNPNQNYAGHTDPGNGADNLGSFSYQHGASSPEEADKKQLARLRNAERDIQAQAEQKFDRPLSKEALAAALDLWNQAPMAGDSFVENLPSATPTTEQIVEARSQSYIDPATGKLDAPGLGDAQAVRADQTRRTAEVEQTLQQQRLEQLNKK